MYVVNIFTLIYLAQNHNRSYLRTLFIKSWFRPTLYEINYRDPNNAISNSG